MKEQCTSWRRYDVLHTIFTFMVSISKKSLFPFILACVFIAIGLIGFSSRWTTSSYSFDIATAHAIKFENCYTNQKTHRQKSDGRIEKTRSKNKKKATTYCTTTFEYTVNGITYQDTIKKHDQKDNSFWIMVNTQNPKEYMLIFEIISCIIFTFLGLILLIASCIVIYRDNKSVNSN